MNSSQATTSSNQILLLLVLVIGLGLAASWGIREFTRTAEIAGEGVAAPLDVAGESQSQSTGTREVSSQQALGQSQSKESVEPTEVASPSSPPQPTVVLPRQPVAIDPEKLEIECERFVERLLKTLPEDPHALNLAAMYYSQTYKTAQADELWAKIREMQAADSIVYHNWSTNAIHQGDSVRALEILDMAASAGVSDPQLDYQRAIALNNLGRDNEVEQLLGPLVESQQMTGGLWLQLGLSLIKLGKHAEARDSLLKAQQAGIVNKPLFNGLISCSVRLKDREAAQRYRDELQGLEEKITEFGQEQYQTRSATRIRTFSLGILGEGIEVYRLAGRLDDAEHAALRVLAFEPNQLEAYDLLHRIYVDRKQLANQLAVLERMAELQPGYLLNYLLMAKTASMMGEHARAEALIKLTISLGPDDATSWIAMAEYLLERQEPQRAVWYIERALELDPNPQGKSLLERAKQMVNGQPAASAALPTAAPQRRFPTVPARPEGK